ncbi:MAG TPA: DUF2911 domain-containing protein [Gemmatimonadaceae bacterium]|nr:DUF2911 domain-containing protein [Gemmatimonadaceae bacterium]
MRLFLVGLIAAGAAAAVAARTAPNERASFVTTLGRDTVVIESFTRSNNHIDGDIVVRVPGTVLCHYSADLAKDGSATKTVVDIKPLGTTDVKAQKISTTYEDGAAKITLEMPGQDPKMGIKMLDKNGFPFFMTGFGASYGLYSSLGMYEMFLPRVTSKVNDTTAVKSIDMASANMGTRTFVRRSPTQVAVDYFGVGYTDLTVDANGQITGADATHATTEKTVTSRADYIDAGKLASTYAAADKAGHGIGAASPNKVQRGTLAGQQIMVTFGSPKKRGRDILGNVVPYDRVWRTGANEATVLDLGHDAMIGGAAVPAGTYSLWTLPAKGGTVTLIINKQHGQWGTDYDPAQDLVRVPMQVTTASSPQEDFNIAVTGSGNADELRMSWDTFVWTVPITAK